jgi:myo-inositol-1(or 4)-monophosphatase
MLDSIGLRLLARSRIAEADRFDPSREPPADSKRDRLVLANRLAANLRPYLEGSIPSACLYNLSHRIQLNFIPRYHNLHDRTEQETKHKLTTNQTMDSSLEEALAIAHAAARAAGTILREMLNTASVREKGPKDLVTDADIAAQGVIEAHLLTAFPSHGFIGEESPSDFREIMHAQQWTWLVDPLDGTANYVHRLPSFAVSIALVSGSKTKLGVVYDPMAEELYSAIEGMGATLNGQPISVSCCENLREAMVAVSFPPIVRKDSPEVGQFLEVLVHSQSVRRLGSAALNLCYVGHGRLDAYWANRLKPWDVAAGALIASEAGASLHDLSGNAFDLWSGEVLTASSSSLADQMLQCIQIGSRPA